ncbi:AMP-binding protein [Magnetovibrio sp. PR-2]|uniref:AMP-binding protein n=1 Tax=Magnetovibrio sp. PR-2 TaxID=3120356 RepID=UPI002FCE00D9
MVKDYYSKMLGVFKNSERDAFVRYDERHSYTEMYANMLKVNSLLSQFQNRRVVIYANKDFNTYCALFATVLSGNAWVPMNPTLPPNRVLEMMSQAEPEVILSDQDLPAELSDYASEKNVPVYRLEALIEEDDVADFNLDNIQADNDAIVYFTSGSTGMPKGVPLKHKNYIQTVENLLELLPFNQGEIFADYHDLGFVISVPILFPCVMTESAISPALNNMDLLMPGNHLAANNITVLITVPSTIASIRRLKPDGLPTVQFNIIVSCGEPMHIDILEYCLDKLNAHQVNNFYGSTEVSCWTFRHLCQAEDVERFAQFGVMPIGSLLPGTEMKIVENGELCVSGVQITSGYLNGVNPEAFSVEDGQTWFHTGDKAVPFEDVWICKGRLDSQVKISGYRIELSDTEAHLRAMDGVEAAVCVVAGEAEGKYIVGILHTKKTIDVSEVKSFLASRLPSYMHPKKVICKADMPLNKSGKIDRSGLKQAFFDGTLTADAKAGK